MPLLGHAGAGATWQALLVLLSFGTVVIFVLAVAGRLVLDEPGDLVLPLAGSAILASLSGTTAGFLSDWVGWWFPLGVSALVAVVVAASTRWSLGPTSPLAIGAVVVAVVAAVTLHTTIEGAWHPTGTGVGARWTDAQLALVTPTDGQDVAVGEVEVVAAVQGGTIGPGPATTTPGDPEEGGVVRLYVDGRLQSDADGQALPPDEDCTSGCAQVTYTVELERGVHVLSLEFLTADGQSFDTPQGQSPTVRIATVEAG